MLTVNDFEGKTRQLCRHIVAFVFHPYLRWIGILEPFFKKGNTFREFNLASLEDEVLNHCILVNSATVICWTSLFVNKGYGSICRFYSI